MSERQKHLFRYQASQVAKAATKMAAYHEERQRYWQGEYDQSVAVLKETASVKLVEHGVTGGTRMDFVVDLGVGENIGPPGPSEGVPDGRGDLRQSGRP